MNSVNRLTKMKNSVFFFTLVFALTSQAQNNAIIRHSAFAQLGSTGAGVGYHYQFHPKFAAGGAISYIHAVPTLFLKNVSQSKQHRLTANANFTDASIFVKWFPKGKEYYDEWEGNAFYIKAGALYRANAALFVKSVFQPKQAGRGFISSDPIVGFLNVDIQTAPIQPFLAVGHTLFGKTNRFKVMLEWGASYHGRPQYQIKQTTTPGITPVNENRIPGILNGITIYPILNAQLGYSF